jgi:nanoRNase/pAp phosphatase (c-di-AMP/oligoRNAs hydrolase)
MDSAKQQLADKLKSANNVMVTVSRNPSVDQLAALIGLTLLLNKLGKHAAAVFSGEVPSTLEFLQPEETIEKNTDSLRDFIIALDKSKADKLRYKVEDNVVRIFITPYRTSISQEDLEFSQGDFNVDVVVALGVREQGDLDDAITMHGRILHDATVSTINTSADGDLGGINWHDASASSLSELVTELAQALDKDLLDGQIATALLTGIVAETNRFSNDKTTSQTMSASAALMTAGANQQLVASKLEESPRQPAPKKGRNKPAANADEQASKNDNGTLRIDHLQTDEEEPSESMELPEPQEEAPRVETAKKKPETPPADTASNSTRPLMTEPPSFGGSLTANTQAEGLDPITDPLSLPKTENSQLLNRPPGSQSPAPILPPPPESLEPPVPPMPPPTPEPSVPPEPTTQPAPQLTSPPPEWSPPAAPKPTPPPPPPAAEPVVPEPEPTPPSPAPKPSTKDKKPKNTSEPAPTLTDLEASVHSPHVDSQSIDTARDEVNKALSSVLNEAPGPIQALNAKPLGADLHPDNPTAETDVPSLEEQIPGLKMTPDEPSAPTQGNNPAPATPEVVNPNAPPPVPPPLPPQFTAPGSNPLQQ